MKTNLVIAGGTSFIAKNLIRGLDPERYEMTSFIRTKIPSREAAGQVRQIPLKMEEYGSLGQYVSKCDCYIPFTWDGTKREDRNNREKNENSYRCILDSIKSVIEKCGCSKVILPGTFSEYRNRHTPIDEKTDCDSDLEYGRYKYKLYEDAYELCLRKGVRFVEARLFSIYGEGDSEEKMINRILSGMLKNEEIPLTPGEQIWDFLYISDVVGAFRKLIESDVEDGCYNIATDEHRTLRSYIEEMKEVTGSQSNLAFGAIPYGTEMVPHVICVTDKISRATGWSPQVKFSEGIEKMADYYKDSRSR